VVLSTDVDGGRELIGTGGMGRLQRSTRGLEISVANPMGCMVPLVIPGGAGGRRRPAGLEACSAISLQTVWWHASSTTARGRDTGPGDRDLPLRGVSVCVLVLPPTGSKTHERVANHASSASTE